MPNPSRTTTGFSGRLMLEGAAFAIAAGYLVLVFSGSLPDGAVRDAPVTIATDGPLSLVPPSMKAVPNLALVRAGQPVRDAGDAAALFDGTRWLSGQVIVSATPPATAPQAAPAAAPAAGLPAVAPPRRAVASVSGPAPLPPERPAVRAVATVATVAVTTSPPRERDAGTRVFGIPVPGVLASGDRLVDTARRVASDIVGLVDPFL